MNENNMQAVLDAGMQIGDAKVVPYGAVPYLVRPALTAVESLEPFMDHPARKKGGAKFRDLASFALYLAQHGTDATAVQVDVDVWPVRFMAILDYHQPGELGKPGWKHHTALFAPKLSEQFMRWVGKDKTWQAQSDFAEFLQDNLMDVRRPEGAALLEIAKDLVAKKSFDFRSGKNLANGTVQFSYVEDMTAAGGAGGVLEVPESFTIALPVHYASLQAYVLEVRLRFKIEQSKLLFRYEILQLQRTLDVVLTELLNEVRLATSRTVFVGTLI